MLALEQHEIFIGALGGPVQVARMVSTLSKLSVPPQRVVRWQKRGIPKRYRKVFFTLALAYGARLPNDFLV